MNLRKIALITAMLLTVMSLSVFADLPKTLQTDKSFDSAYEEAAVLLTALSVNSLNNPEKTVTYNIFYDAISTVLSEEGQSYDISYLTGIDFSAATGNINLTYDDAVRSLVNLLGYKVKADALNGTSSAYYTVAQQIGLLKNTQVPADGKMNAKVTAVLIKNALNIEPLQKTGIGSRSQYETIKGETLIYVYRGIRSSTGIVTANEFTSLSSGNGAQKEAVKINDVIFGDENRVAEDLIGYNIRYYYYDNFETDEILTALTYKNDVVTIDGNYCGRTGRKIYYLNDSGTEEYCVIPGDAAFIYNGVALPRYDADMLDFSNKYAEIIDNNRDGEADVVIVRESVEIFVLSTDTALMTINDGIGKRTVDVSKFGPYERVRFFDANGEDSYFYGINAGDIISAYISRDNSLFDGYICNKRIEGKLTAKETNEVYGTIVTIDDTEYKLTTDFAKREKDNLVIGNIGTFYLNKDGKIAYAKYTDSQLTYGYVIGTDSIGDMGSNVFACMVKADGEVESLNFNNHVKVDGKSYKNSESARTAVDNGIATAGSGVIRYDVTEDGKIYYVDTAYRGNNEGDDTLFAFGSMSGDKYIQSTTLFPNKFWIDPDNTLVFFAPSDESLQTPDHFGLAMPKRLINNETYMVQGFGTDKDNYIPEVVIVDRDYAEDLQISSFVSQACMLKSITKVLNDEGDETYKIDYYETVTPKVTLCENVSVLSGIELNEGDIFTGILNHKEEFTDIIKLYDAKTHTLDVSYYDNAGIATDNFFNAHYYCSGYVYFVTNNIIGICQDDPSAITDMGDGQIMYFTINNYRGCVYDLSYPEGDERRIRPTSGGEIKDYVKNGSDCARVFFKGRYGDTYAIFTFQE